MPTKPVCPGRGQQREEETVVEPMLPLSLSVTTEVKISKEKLESHRTNGRLCTRGFI